jgi:hypothetical protein
MKVLFRVMKLMLWLLVGDRIVIAGIRAGSGMQTPWVTPQLGQTGAWKTRDHLIEKCMSGF